MPDLTLDAAISLAADEFDAGRFDTAEALYLQILRHVPDFPQALHTLGVICTKTRRSSQAIAFLQRTVQVAPDWAEAHFNLALAQHRSDPDSAIASLGRAIALMPGWMSPRLNLTSLLGDTAQIDLAIEQARQSLQINPTNALIGSNILYLLHFDPACTPVELAREHRDWAAQHGRKHVSLFKPHDNPPIPDRPLRIGFVSADLWDHPVGRFLLPLLCHQDRPAFSSFCYCCNTKSDSITEQLRATGGTWRPVAGVSDQQLIEEIRSDRIDLLVDLSLHTQGNRLAVFSARPAPVQLTYLAYCSTSGLVSMDYRISDRFLDPPNAPAEWFTEKTLTLQGTYWCYRPTSQTPEVVPTPAIANHFVTFGCLNAFRKVTPFTIDLWQRVLKTVEHARLILHAPPGRHRQRLLDRFSTSGIDPARIEFHPKVSRDQYFALHQRIDIALDCYPYGGGTTSCDALWMGLPVVTLAGQTGVSRAGLSILSHLGLGELVANDSEQYVQIASRLAGDIAALDSLRQSMRPRMRRSPIMDEPAFCSDMHRLFRQAWQDYCRSSNH